MKLKHKTSFDLIAPYYNFLEKLVFGRKLIAAQNHFQREISGAKSVLVLGGGNGNAILELLNTTTIKRIDYLEASEKMIKRAFKKNRIHSNRINFIHDNALNYTIQKKYDVILMPFFLDCFMQNQVDSLLLKCYKNLSSDGCVIITDFSVPKENKVNTLLGKIVIGIMYAFFRFFKALESKKLPDFDQAIRCAGFIELNKVAFLHGLIFSCIVKK